MVRVKTRWILLRLDVDVQNDKNSGNNDKIKFPTAKELYFFLSDAHVQNFGLAVCAQARDIQVRFCDAATKLALIRVLRQDYNAIRATLTLTTRITKKTATSRLAALSILCVHGNVQTAKRAAILQVQKLYRRHLQEEVQNNLNKNKNQWLQRESAAYQATIQALHAINF